MSTGMGTLEEIEDAVSAIRRQGNEQIVLLRCASAYPAVSDEMNLLTMQDMRQRFSTLVGLSDHSMGAVAAVTAVALGANVIEKHFCLSRSIANPDASFSMEPAEFAQMVQDIRTAERAIGEVKYGPTSQERGSLIFRRSIFTVKAVKKGERFTEENIRVIRPGFGLKPKEMQKVIGKRAKMDLDYGTPLSWEAVDEA